MRPLSLLIVFLTSLSLSAQEAGFINNHGWTVLKNERYGPGERNLFDIVLPVSGTPTALVIYIHGGGFVAGDKDVPFKWRQQDVKWFLEHNIAYASLSYSFYKTSDSAGVNRCLQDVVMALQYIRHHAAKYNISKERIGCYGHSAGAGSSLYLAFHDDFAKPGDTTLLGESTRIRCCGALDTQATYDLFRWLDFIPGLNTVVGLAKKPFYAAIANFYGYPDYPSFSPVQDQTVAKLDMLRMISQDDPPTYVMNLQKQRVPVSFGIIQHHRRHALILDEILTEKKVEHIAFVRTSTIKAEKDVSEPVTEFIAKYLK
jgi:acetyl esterase/lipase